MDGPTLVTRWGEELFRLDPAGGELLDRRPVPELSLSLGVVVQGAAIGPYWADDAYWCGRLELDRGIVLWRRRILGPDVGFLTAAADVVGLDLAESAYAGLDLATGAERWRLDLADRAAWTDSFGQRLPGSLAGWAVAAGELLVLPVAGHHVLGVDAASGELRWDQRVSLAMPSSFAYDGGRRWYCAGDTNFLCVDTETGELLLTADTREAYQAAGAYGLGPLALSESHVWGASVRRGTLVALDRADGSVAWTHALDGRFPPRNPPVVLDGRLYLLDMTAGRLHVLEEE
jgi:outer membrane protein assembly factor BamB